MNQKAWIVNVTDAQPATLGNETYTLYGASQRLGVSTASIGTSTVEVVQAVMWDVALSPASCRRNPSAGNALIRTIRITDSNTSSAIDMGSAWLTFGSACSGNANITIATGVYVGRIGSSTALNLDQ